ncbi:signal peptidase II [Frigoribacterium salinisoli]
MPRPTSPATKVSGRVLVVLAFVAVVAYALDQISKALVVGHLVEGQTVDVLGRVLQLHFVKNPGAAFSLASGSTWIFSIAATVVVVAIVVFARRIRSVAWAVLFGMLLGGTLGNLTDRVLREPSFGQGHVIDFLYLPWILPAIFNVADVFIVSSMGLLILLTVLGVGLDGTRGASSRDDEEGHARPPHDPQHVADAPAAAGDAARPVQDGRS